MDDPAWTWPAWKFGMKRDDLFSSLHDQYNTFSFNIQDIEAFHHDVSEISRDADTADEFHRMMAERRQMRLHELNKSLESLAIEIIANPKLLGIDQWQHALQLFRTKSYDSIVRYYASYLPENYLDRHDTRSVISSSTFSETDSVSTAASSVDEDEFSPRGPVTTDEVCSFKTSDDAFDVNTRPSTPVSETAPSEFSSLSDSEHDSIPGERLNDSHVLLFNPSSRSMSFSDSESGDLVPDLTRQRCFGVMHHTRSQLGDSSHRVPGSSNPTEATAVEVAPEYTHAIAETPQSEDEAADIPTTQPPDNEFLSLDHSNNTNPHDIPGSDTPTPRSEASAAFFTELRSVVSTKASSSYQRCPSPKPCSASRCGTPPMCHSRRSPEESSSKIQKCVPDLSRKRLARKRPD
ncbi:hypothetical protein AAL_01306 [Moelleriella libera RCEF 2490]|uniref:Uncharacterized protein n=1 Tax=Moelleriella libera RCEF 2490 TaxID=1081109 RepID=A0A166U2Q6_9HYPO|nr:hypothetical protein AAL_01306 [Moelleriella libera RCEF 2490]